MNYNIFLKNYFYKQAEKIAFIKYVCLMPMKSARGCYQMFLMSLLIFPVSCKIINHISLGIVIQGIER